MKALNRNQILLLSKINENSESTITSLLTKLSNELDIPLSTLKFNAKILKSLNLIEFKQNDKARIVCLSEAGKFILNIVNLQFNENYLSIIKNLSEAKLIFPSISQSRTFLEEPLLNNLKAIASRIRENVVRMISEAGSGHLGASLSIIDILVVLYFLKIKHDPKNPSWSERDRVILSKGHAAPALYAVLAECGYFPTSLLSSLRRIDSFLQGHPEVYIPGIDMVSGSLGQGLSIANGMALSFRLNGKNNRVYVIMGDGELNEGQVWEAALTSSHLMLDNITVIIDRNGFQQEGSTENIKRLEPLAEKWKAFGWHAIEIDGHDLNQIIAALNEAELTKGYPTVIIAHTIKGFQQNY
ncbi:MAG: transketolase [Candidatus Methanomethylicia archaeon]